MSYGMDRVSGNMKRLNKWTDATISAVLAAIAAVFYI
jgi:hypothetical protein